MKLAKRILVATLLLGISPVATVYAQSEQWLEYKLTKEEVGFRWLELSTNPPPNIALPKELGPKPYFARWSTPLDTNGGRWIILDQLRKNGPYNRLYVDSVGNGRLDDKQPIISGRAQYSNIHFDGVRFSLKGDDGPVAYHLNLMVYTYDNDVRAYISSAGSYVGQVSFDGVKKKVELVDGNLNAAFNDRLPNTDCDRISIGSGNGSESFMLGRLVEVDGKYYKIETARDGAYVKVQKAQNLSFGQVKVPTGIKKLTLIGENGQFERVPSNGVFSVPAGKYKTYYWEITRKDEKGVNWRLAGSRPNESGVFSVAADKTVSVDIGEPVYASITSNESKDSRQVSFNLHFSGRFGESIDFSKNDQQPRGPKLVLTNAIGAIAFTNSFEFG